MLVVDTICLPNRSFSSISKAFAMHGNDLSGGKLNCIDSEGDGDGDGGDDSDGMNGVDVDEMELKRNIGDGGCSRTGGDGVDVDIGNGVDVSVDFNDGKHWIILCTFF